VRPRAARAPDLFGEFSGELVGFGSGEPVAHAVLVGSDERMAFGLLLPEPLTEGQRGDPEPLGDLGGRHDLGHDGEV
jgi:hypothetical protein